MCPARGMGHFPRVSPASVSSERRWVMKHQCSPFYFQSFLFHSTEKQTNRGTARGGRGAENQTRQLSWSLGISRGRNPHLPS